VCIFNSSICYYGIFFCVEISITLSTSTTYFSCSNFELFLFYKGMGGRRRGGVGGGVVVFGLVQPELPSLPSSSSFGQSESPNLCILTCSIFRNLDDVVHPSVGVVHGKCKLEITCPPFFFPMPVHIGSPRFFWQAISDYVFFLVPHPSEPSPTSKLSCYPWPRSYLV